MLLKHYLNVNSRSYTYSDFYAVDKNFFFLLMNLHFFDASVNKLPTPPNGRKENYDVSKGLECSHLTLTCHLFKGSINFSSTIKPLTARLTIKQATRRAIAFQKHQGVPRSFSLTAGSLKFALFQGDNRKFINRSIFIFSAT